MGARGETVARQNRARAVPAEMRFWAKVNQNGPVPEYAPHLGNCWIWTASRTRHGYGRFHPSITKTVDAHVFLNGNAPVGLQWDHLCRVKHCVRRDHLEPVTVAENIRRRDIAKRR